MSLQPFTFGELWAGSEGFACKHPGCSAKTSTIYLNAQELYWMWSHRDLPTDVVLMHVFNKFGLARCEEHKPIGD